MLFLDLLVTKVLKAKIRLFKNKYLDHNCLISDTGEQQPMRPRLIKIASIYYSDWLNLIPVTIISSEAG